MGGENDEKNYREPLIFEYRFFFPLKYLLFSEQGFDPTKFHYEYPRKNASLRRDSTALCLI